MGEFFKNFQNIDAPFFATLVLAAVLSFLSVHVILRRVVFLGIALSEMSSLGIASSFFFEQWALTAPGTIFSFTRGHLEMGILFNLASLGFLTPPETRRLSREARIAICFAAAGAIAILMVSGSPHGMDEVRALMVHDLVYISHQDLNVVFATMLPALAILFIFFRRFLLVGLDREMALSLGIHSRRWDLVFYALLGITIATAIHLSGVLFAIGFLVLPGSIALLVARKAWAIFLISTGIGVVCACVGFLLGHVYDLPLAPTTVTIVFVVFLAVYLARPLALRIKRQA